MSNLKKENVFCQLKNKIDISLKEKKNKVLGIVPTVKKETGKQIFEFARYLSSDSKVLFINLNYLFPMSLLDSVDAMDFINKGTIKENDLSVIATKKYPNNFKPFKANELKERINGVKENYDYIIVLSANLKEESDAVDFSEVFDAVYLLVEKQLTDFCVLEKFFDTLKEKEEKPCGIILKGFKNKEVLHLF